MKDSFRPQLFIHLSKEKSFLKSHTSNHFDKELKKLAEKYHLSILKFNDSEMFFAMVSLLSPVIIAIP